MLELAAAGAKVLHSRSVEYARRNDVPIHVRSSFNDRDGTWVTKEEDMEVGMEAALISGIALDDTEAKITFDEVPDRPGIAATLFRAVAAQGVNVDMIVQNVSHEGKTDLSFTVPHGDVP
jgi:aspartate kinase